MKMKNEPRCFLPFSFKTCSFFFFRNHFLYCTSSGKNSCQFYNLFFGANLSSQGLCTNFWQGSHHQRFFYYSLNGRSGNFLSLACACWWWQQKASWPKFDYKVVSILTETFFLGKHFGRIFTLKVSLNIHFRRKNIKLTGISNFVGRKNRSSKKVLEA